LGKSESGIGRSITLTRAVLFMPAARLDLIDAQDWYERQLPGLGAKFRDEIDAQIERIANQPTRFPVLLRDVRRAKVQRFPYGLFFRVMPEAIFIIACFHSSRDPLIWKNRV
jgi:toxin ParE1/3/4